MSSENSQGQLPSDPLITPIKKSPRTRSPSAKSILNSPRTRRTKSKKSVRFDDNIDINVVDITLPTEVINQSPTESTLPITQTIEVNPVVPISLPTEPVSMFDDIVYSDSDRTIKDTNRNAQYNSELIEKYSIEKILLDNDYKAHNKIVVNNGNEKVAKYIRATNMLGHTVYVLVDIDGYTTVSLADMHLNEDTKTSNINHSFKSGAYDCIDQYTCGVAIECGSDSICLITKNSDTLKPNEQVFSRTSSESSDSTTIPYPIVKLSEIISNNTIVLDNTTQVMKRLRNNQLRIEESKLVDTLTAIRQVENTMLHLDSLITSAFDAIKADNNVDIKSRIKKNNNIVNLISIIQQLNNKKIVLDTINSDLTDYISTIHKMF